MLGLHMGKLPTLPDENFFASKDTDYWIQEINRASVVCNVESGLLDRKLACEIRDALNQLRQESLRSQDKCELYITWEPKLLALVGTKASVLHVGRSSQDILATCALQQYRQSMVRFGHCINRLRNTLIDLADREKTALVPAYTNGVQAQPTLYAHYLLAMFEVFSRDLERLHQCFDRYSYSPMGSGVCNGSGWPLDSEKMARFLGLKGVCANAFDAGQCQGNDLPLELASIINAVMLHINLMLSDFMKQYSQAKPWISIRSSNGIYPSSAMPQKRNPGIVNDCRRDAGMVMSQAHSVGLRLQNLSYGMADLRDVITMRDFFKDACTVVMSFDGIVNSLAVDHERALEELNADWTCTQEIADTLVRLSGVDFRSSHRFASYLVTWARKYGKTPVTTTYNEVSRLWSEFAQIQESAKLVLSFPLTEKQLLQSLSSQGIVDERKTIGSTNPEMVLNALKRAHLAIEKENIKYKDWKQGEQLRESELEAKLESL